MPNSEFTNPYLSFEKACAYMGDMPPSTLREYTRNRRITVRKSGKRVAYRMSDLDAFMDQCAQKSMTQLNQEVAQKQQILNS